MASVKQPTLYPFVSKLFTLVRCLTWFCPDHLDSLSSICTHKYFCIKIVGKRVVFNQHGHPSPRSSRASFESKFGSAQFNFDHYSSDGWTHVQVTAEENRAYASWVDSGDAFQSKFAHYSLTIYNRQLNIYGFHKVDTENWIFKHEDGYFMRGNQDHLLKITRRKQQKRAAPADDSIDMRSPKMVKLSSDSTPSTPVVTTPPSPSLARFDDGTLSPTNMDMPSSPDSPTSIQNYLLNELNTLKRKNLTQENTMAWLIQELLKSKKEIEEMKRTVKQLSSDNDEYKRRQALEVIGFRQQELQASFVQPNHPLVSSTNERVYQPHPQQVQESLYVVQSPATQETAFTETYTSEAVYSSQPSEHAFVNSPMPFQSAQIQLPSHQPPSLSGQLAQHQVLQYHDGHDPFDSSHVFSPVLHASSHMPHSGVHGDYY